MKMLTLKFHDDEYAQLKRQACREGISVDLYAYRILKEHIIPEPEPKSDSSNSFEQLSEEQAMKRFEKDLPLMKKLATIKRLPPI